MESLATLLAGLASGVLTVPVVSWLLNQLPDDTLASPGHSVTKTKKRFIAIVASFALGTGAFVLSGYFGYSPLPAATVQAWLEALWPVWGLAFTASQAILAGYKSAK